MENIIFFVNGEQKVVDQTLHAESLLSYLRHSVQLTGTKQGCNEGGCGACTIMVSEFDPITQKTKHSSALACLLTLQQINLKSITTVEAIGSTRTKLHPIQDRLARYHGSQCGYCTPGFVVSMYSLLRNNASPTQEEIEKAIDGNLCRCTGYRAILEAFSTFSSDQENVCALGENCCRMSKNNKSSQNIFTSEKKDTEREKYESKIDTTQEIIFPPQLKVLLQKKAPPAAAQQYYSPKTINECLALMADSKHDDMEIVAGNTVSKLLETPSNKKLIIVRDITELKQVNEIDNSFCYGPSLTLSECGGVINNQMKNYKECQPLETFKDIVCNIANTQIRNQGTLGGDLLWLNPIADLKPFAVVAEMQLEFRTPGGVTTSPYSIWHQMSKHERALLTGIYLPKWKNNEYIFALKIAPRRKVCLADLNFAAYYKVSVDSMQLLKFDSVRLCFGYPGGVEELDDLVTAIEGRVLDSSLVDIARKSICDFVSNLENNGQNKQLLAINLTSLFLKTIANVARHSNVEQNGVAQYDTCGTSNYLNKFDAFEATHSYQEVENNEFDYVGRPMSVVSAERQVTGEAEFISDMHPNGLHYAAPVLSTRPHAKLLGIDTSKALKVEGVVSFIGAKEFATIKGANMKVPQFGYPEPVFALETVESVGQIIGIVVAKSDDIAHAAAELVKVTYEDLPAIVTIRDAIAKKSEYGSRVLSFGDCTSIDGNNSEVLGYQGSHVLGGQEHFYMETQCAVAEPVENQEIIIHSGCQNVTLVQTSVAIALGIPANRVIAKAKRVGGAFGGKESKSWITAVQASIAATLLNKPICMFLRRREDMLASGGKHGFEIDYKIAMSKDLKLLGFDLKEYANGGWTKDISVMMLEHAISRGVNNAYYIPNVEVYGAVYKTNLPSNTAMRGLGGPQGMFFIEEALTNLAHAHNVKPEQIRERNLIAEGEQFAWKQVATECLNQRCWDELKLVSNYDVRRKQIDEFNKQNKYVKKGLAIVPTACGMGFPQAFKQATALVNAYADGSVVISYGGIEMGQGLHTKTLQVASRVLGLPLDMLRINETTDSLIIPNGVPTAGSMGTDLFAEAVKIACEELLERVKPFRKEGVSWTQSVSAAFWSQTSLCCVGFFKKLGHHYDFDKKSGGWDYMSYGAAAVEVTVDCLTGQHKMNRVDIVNDSGDSLNPALDIGQVEGGFMQGYGLWCMEDLNFVDGQLKTLGPNHYKIPAISDAPRKFNVHLLKKATYKPIIYGSKGIGEPPVLFGAAPYFAIKDAIHAFRVENELQGAFRLDCPAVPQRVRLACVDDIVKSVGIN